MMIDTNANTYSDYMMIISPPHEVIEMINKYKKATARVIGPYNGMQGKAHISVCCQYRQMTAMMKQKLDCYQKSVSRLQPVPLVVNGFSFFKHGHTGATIYAKIELHTQVNGWFTELKKIFGDKKKNMVPHITVAKDIPVDLFQKLWPNFIGKQYQESFLPQSITVLSRPTIGGNQQHWTPFKELYFKNFN